MSYPKVTSQNYNNLGGINEKASDYSTERTQFLRISNLDFSIPNALNKRAGSTQIVGLSAGHSAPITSLYEYTKFEGFSQVVFGSRFGLHRVEGSGFTDIISNSNVVQFDYQTFNNQLWAFNGQTSIDYTGTSVFSFGIPPTRRYNGGFSLVGGGGNGFSFGASSFNAFYAFSYIKYGGQEIPSLYKNVFLNATTTIQSVPLPDLSLIGVPDGASAMFLPISLVGVPSVSLASFGVEKLGVYRYILTGPSANPNFAPNLLTKLTEIDAGSTQFIDTFGYTLFPQNPAYPNYEMPFWKSTNTGITGSASLVAVPSFVEVYNNSFFLAGFSANPSRVYFSEIGQPENIKPENFFDVRTNDGDRIRGIKTYLDQMLAFKEDSFHRVTGDDVTNYTLVQVTDEYGALNNNVIVEAENTLYFMDRRGFVQYNGTAWNLMSYEIEDTFKRVNIETSINTACGVHKKSANQIWFSCPLEGSSVNNITFVYDYILEAWTFFEGIDAASYGILQRNLTDQYVHWGSPSGLIKMSSASFLADNGAGISLQARTRFEYPNGSNVESLFRRLFLDVTAIANGQSQAIEITGYPNFSYATANLSLVAQQATFQTKFDFGIPARSYGFEFNHFSPSLPFTLNGYGLATRYLRDK